MTEQLTQAEMLRFMQKATRRDIERTINALGEGREYTEALKTEVGKRLTTFLSARILQLENAILSGTESKLMPEGCENPALEARVEYRVCKAHARFILGVVNDYEKLITQVRKTAGTEPAAENG